MYKHSDWVTTVSPGKVEKIKNHVISVGGKKGGPDHVDKVKLVGNGFDESVENSSIDKIKDIQQAKPNGVLCYLGTASIIDKYEVPIILNLTASTEYKTHTKKILVSTIEQAIAIDAAAVVQCYVNDRMACDHDIIGAEDALIDDIILWYKK